MILIAVGSQKFQFDRLLKKIDYLVDVGAITEEIFAQTGASTYVPKNYEYQDFLDEREFKEKLEKSELVITHGGTGIITNAIKMGKKVIAVPRKAKYGEHVDDHQQQLINQFVKQNFIWGCMDVEDLEKYIKLSKENEKDPYRSNTETYIREFESLLKEWYNK